MKIEELNNLKVLLILVKKDGTKSYVEYETDENYFNKEQIMSITDLFDHYLRMGLREHENVQIENPNRKTLQDVFPNEKLGRLGLLEADAFGIGVIKEILRKENKD